MTEIQEYEDSIYPIRSRVSNSEGLDFLHISEAFLSMARIFFPALLTLIGDGNWARCSRLYRNLPQTIAIRERRLDLLLHEVRFVDVFLDRVNI